LIAAADARIYILPCATFVVTSFNHFFGVMCQLLNVLKT